MTLPWCAYTADSGDVFALEAGPVARALFGFVPVAGPTRKLPRGLRPRVEIFVSASGETVFERYAAPGLALAPGTTVTLRGDPTYTAVATLGEKGEQNG